MDNRIVEKEDASGQCASTVGLGLVDDLRTEADLCRNETAEDIAVLLDAAADEIERLQIELKNWHDFSHALAAAGLSGLTVPMPPNVKLSAGERREEKL